MENLDALKLELISQKVAIENKGGVVSVANSNPSPSEITLGIKSIAVPDFTSANATVDDVVDGKTFYAGNGNLKVGTKVVPDLTVATASEDDVILGKTFYAGDNTIKTGAKELPKLENATATIEDVLVGKTFFAGDNTIKTGTKQVADLSNATATPEDVIAGKTFYAGNQELKVGTCENNVEIYSKIFISDSTYGDELLYFTIPSGITKLKKYFLYENTKKNMVITFNEDLQEVGDYAFASCEKTTFPNLPNLTNLVKIGQYSFSGIANGSLELDRLPTSITTLSMRSFYNSIRVNSNISLHKAVKSIGNYCFATAYKKEMNSLTIADDIETTQLPGYMFENLIFNCDFRVPSTVTSLATSFGYGCSFNNITIPATCKTIGNGAFYANTTEAASYRRLQTVTFESETPPTFSTYIFAKQDKTNGFKIYVPDNAVDTYKANAKLADFVDYIYPISQKS